MPAEQLDDCPELYDGSTLFQQFVDGPLTLLVAACSLLGARLAVKFLACAGLNKELTAGGSFFGLTVDNLQIVRHICRKSIDVANNDLI